MPVGSREAEQDSGSSSPPLQPQLIEEPALEQDNASARESGARGQWWVGPVVGLLLFALYVAMLARNDLDAAMGRGSLPRLPGRLEKHNRRACPCGGFPLGRSRVAGNSARRIGAGVGLASSRVAGYRGCDAGGLLPASFRHQRQSALHKLP